MCRKQLYKSKASVTHHDARTSPASIHRHFAAWPRLAIWEGISAYTPDMAEEASQIPACQRCRLRKIKCDHAAPKCSGCTKASAACIIIDPFTQKQYTRDYIDELERKEKELLGKAQAGTARSATNATPNDQSETSPRDAPSAESTTTYGGYVGDSSGLK